jgi:hypothetical protein
MLLWFAGGSWLLIWAVLQDPAVDYRLVMAGALLPDAIDGPFGGIGGAHSLAVSVAVLLVVMVATIGRRRLRRRLLALPMGMLVHLALDGVWTTTRVFWWPVKGWSLAGAGRLPSLAHPVAVTVVEELVGAAALAWCWTRLGLTDRDRRTRWLRTGRLAVETGPRGGTAGLPSRRGGRSGPRADRRPPPRDPPPDPGGPDR